jgi:hypothetical protein
MSKLSLIRHLFSGASERSVKTIAPKLNVSEEKLKAWIDEIKEDKEFALKTVQGGGLSITSLLNDEEATYSLIAPSVQEWIKTCIYRSYGSTKYRVKTTHKNKLTGRWGTPDFTAVCAHKFTYAAPSALEVVSFEVKHSVTQFDVTAVYEALAHTRASNYSVLFYYDPPENSYASRGLDEVFDEIKFSCSSVGVGLIVSSYPSELKSWKYLVMAERHTTDLRKVDLFLEEAFKTAEDRKWFKDET